MREGKLRCQGAFAHPILAGCFWASVLPLIAAQWWRGGLARWLSVIGLAGASVVIVLCASSTPLMAALFGAISGAMFVARRWMRIVRWSLLAVVVALHVVMIAPVWHLISRLQVIGGSTSYHRFALIDSAICYGREWWMMGTTVGTAHWGYGMEDVTNYYIVQGLQGGIGLLALFVGVIAMGYRAVGTTWRAAGKSRANQVLAWAMGVSLFVHTTSFLGVSYFGQINLIWYLTLAIIASLEAFATVKAKAPVPTPSRVRRTRRRAVAQPVPAGVWSIGLN
jgi:hypothetical protein